MLRKLQSCSHHQKRIDNFGHPIPSLDHQYFVVQLDNKPDCLDSLSYFETIGYPTDFVPSLDQVAVEIR